MIIADYENATVDANPLHHACTNDKDELSDSIVRLR